MYSSLRAGCGSSICPWRDCRTRAVLVDDFLLDRDEAASRTAGASVTILRLMGSGVPQSQEWDPMYTRLRGGWERALLRLKVSFERKEEPSPGILVPQTRRPPPEDKLLEWPEPTPPKKR